MLLAAKSQREERLGAKGMRAEGLSGLGVGAK